jgi:hypothetical protein
VSGFFDGSIPVDSDFRATFHQSLVTITRGDASTMISVTVEPK